MMGSRVPAMAATSQELVRIGSQQVEASNCLLQILVPKFIDIDGGESAERFRLQFLSLAGKMEKLLEISASGFAGERSQFGLHRWHSIQQDDVMNQRLVGSYDSRQLVAGNLNGRFALCSGSDPSSLEFGKEASGGRPKAKLMGISNDAELI
jgi:hypothetical protein